MNKKKKRNSILIQPIIIIVDVVLLNLSIYFFAEKNFDFINFAIFLSISWVFIAYYTKFYKIYRYTHFTKLISNTFAQFSIFTLAFFSFFSIFKEGDVVNRQTAILISITISISFFKLLIFFILKNYRTVGKNIRNVVVFGSSKTSQNLVKTFLDKDDLGYVLKGFFSDIKVRSKHYSGNVNYGLDFAKKNKIDEIYCELSSVEDTQLKKIRKFADKNDIKIRLIPKNRTIYSKDFVLEYYGLQPILKPKELPFEKFETHFVKRVFDILFSLLISIFLLSWLLPILFIFVKLDSKGSFFFKQKRDGVDGKQFYCYKIRTMKTNAMADKISASKEDKRVTKFGKFLRKSSLDELPQFFNVLKGDMSVVGPRPHMNIQTEKYLREIENYVVRNSIKPGITGLAQISGYRGEVKKKSDIENRVRLDIFYIENWSLILDIKIVVQTFANFFKEEEKAY